MPNQFVKRYYPSLSDLISLTSLEGTALEFVKDALQNVLSNLHYKDLQVSKTSKGDSGFYRLALVSNSEIEFTIPGTEVSLIINKDALDPAISSFPISVEYEWKALAIVRTLSSQDLPAAFEDFVDLAVEVFQIDEKTLLHEAVANYPNDNLSSDSYSQIAAQLNTEFGVSISAPSSSSQSPLEDLLVEVKTKVLSPQNISMIGALFQTFMQDSNIDQSWAKINSYFRRIIGEDVKEKLIKYITPHIKVASTLTGHLAIPRKWLIPLDANDEPLPVTSSPSATVEEPRATFQFSKVDLILDSQTGPNLQADFSISLSNPVMLGNSGLIIRSFNNLKLDLRDDSNISEIAADGRRDTFKGVYLKECEIEFPKNWNFSSSSLSATAPKIIAKDLIFGNEGGVSGIFTVQGANREKYIPFVVSNPSNDLSQFTINAAENSITITGDDSSKTYSVTFLTGEKFYIRDFNNNYYYFSEQGVLSKSITAAPSAILSYTFPNNLSISLDSFYLHFQQNRVVESAVVGTLSGSNFQPIRITVEFQDGFLVKAYVPAGQPFVNNSNVEIKLDGLEFGKVSNEWQFGIAGSVKAKKLPPVVDKFLPEYFHLHRLFYKQSSGFQFDLELGWKNGTVIRGNNEGGLTGYIPINLSAENNGLLLKGINISAKAAPNAEIEALLVGAGFKIGPLTASVDGFGAKLAIKEVDEADPSATFGAIKSEISIVGPKGIFVEIKTPVVTGSGYLSLSEDEYIGALHLSIKSVSVNAIGIINTKLPDGSNGISLLVIISATFPAVPLVMALTLNGIGGLLGLHRTMKTEAIRIGISDNSIEHILFPEINQKSIGPIVTDLKQIFPMQKDQFVVGPMFKFGWPTPRVVDITMGVLIEFSNPYRIVIVGRLSIQKPKEAAVKTLVINVGFIGIIDFDKKYATFDATIYNSKIAGLSLEGDIAVRVFWGQQKEVVASIGGFHPAFNPPAYLLLPASMKRITIALKANGDNKDNKLTLTLYLAVTSNTIQFGAKIYLFRKFSTFEIEGYLGIDVLFQLSPFKFIAAVSAGFAVSVNGREILGISLDFSLEGPKPWHAIGNATFTLLGIDKEAHFEKTWGDQAAVSPPSSVTIGPLLKNALENIENWLAPLPDTKELLVAVRVWPATQLVMHPTGTLTITQKVIPFGIKIQRIGTDIPTDGGIFDITQVKIETQPQATASAREDFAPAQFRDMSDDEKLKAASFEYLRAGVTVTSTQDLFAEGFLLKEVLYDVRIIDNDERIPVKNVQLDSILVNQLTVGGVISSNEVSKTSILGLVHTQSVNVSISPEPFGLRSRDSLSIPGGIPQTFPSHAEAEAFRESAGAIANALVSVPSYY